MSIVLGLNCNHADSSACIIKDGKLLFGIEEERINRIKHWAGIPIKSIQECLVQTNINISEITDVTVNTNPRSNIIKKSIYFLKNYTLGKKKFEIFERLKKKFYIINEINSHFYPEKISEHVKIKYIDHHLSHIASAFYPSGFENAVGLSIDGFGDFKSLAIAKCKGDNIKIVKKIFFPNSLGVYYEAFTQLIGFKNYGDEYKFMGLSSYGNPIFVDKIKRNIFKNFKNLELNLNYFNHTNKNYVYQFQGQPTQDKIFNEKIYELFEIKKNYKIEDDYELKTNIACSVQKVFEESVMNICDEIKTLNISENLVYAGGCALNSLANKRIFESKIFKKIFIPYAPGDAGGSIGSASYYLKSKKVNLSNLKTPFIGPNYTNDQVEKIIFGKYNLKNNKVELLTDKNKLNNKIANLLYENKIIGYFNGKMEFGPRALGNRSILANPCGEKIKDLINMKIKRRENFRPFAPAILEEEKDKWFNNNSSNYYMSSVELINENKRKLIPAVTHIDGTGRVQTVSKQLSLNFYNLIETFNKISGVPILLNTSFNENEPIVNEPSQAIDCFLRTHMDALVIENYLITR